jgi:hypothetical protein
MNRHNENILDKCKKYNINTDINYRWEHGIEHHSKSLILMDHLQIIDFEFADDSFCFKIGGDGDNGETLMYEMDIFFELEDAIQDEVEEI